MEVTDASVKSDGYFYYVNGKVRNLTREKGEVFSAKVRDNDGKTYAVTIDVENPKKSECACQKISGKRKLCKHMAALYFAVYPVEAKRYYLLEGAPYDREAHLKKLRKERVKIWALKAERGDLIECLYALIDAISDKAFEKFCNDNRRRPLD